MNRFSLLLIPLLCLCAASANARGDEAPSLKDRHAEEVGSGVTEGNIPDFEEREGADVPLRIEVKAEYQDLKGEADFTTMNQTQSNHVTGGDKPFPVRTPHGDGVEFKKWGFIVNSLPVIDPNNPSRVDTQIQLELSGPAPGESAVGIQTWQLQTEVLSTLGRWKTVSRKPAKVSIRISRDDE